MSFFLTAFLLRQHNTHYVVLYRNKIWEKRMIERYAEKEN